MTEKLNTLLEYLRQIRADQTKTKAELKRISDEYTASLLADPDYVSALNVSSNLLAEEENVTKMLKDEALEIYRVGGDKKPSPKVEIKIFKVIKHTASDSVIRDWCFTNFRPALEMNYKAFDKAVKDGSIPADLAVIEDEPRVQIAASLE